MRVRSVGEREGGLGWLNLGINVNLNIHLSIKMNVVPTNYCEKPVPGLSWRKRLLEVPNVVRKAYWKFHDLWWRHVSCIPQLDGAVIGCRGNQRMAAFSVSDTTGPDFCWVTRQFLPFWTFIVWWRHTKHLQGKKIHFTLQFSITVALTTSGSIHIALSRNCIEEEKKRAL